MFRSLDARGAPVPTLRALRGADYSVLLQAGGPMFLPQRYRSFHIVGVAVAPEYAIVRGEGRARWAQRLTSGDISLHPAGPGEHIVWPEGATCLYINLRPSALRQRSNAASAPATLETHPRIRDAVIHDIAMTLLSLIAESRRDETTVGALVDSLTDHLARHYLTDGMPAPRLGARSLEDVLEELRAAEVTTGSMTDLARSCGLTRAHFTRRFRAATGGSPYALMLGSRVERAKYLLTVRRRSISEVAYETGFTDQSHLSQTFHRLVGMTPVRFRQHHELTTRQVRSTILQDRG